MDEQRGLSTARSALRVTWLLARTPDGVRAENVAAVLGKSMSTTYNVLASLCEERVAERRHPGVYRLTPEFRHVVAGDVEDASTARDLSGVVDDVLARTHKRAYAAVVSDGALRIVAERGLQGMPRLPGLDHEIRDNAHALALGKVVLAFSPPAAVERYIALGLRPFTPNTITDPDDLRAELRTVRRARIAFELQEFDGDFASIAAPLLDARRRLIAAVGISMSRRAFEEERAALAETLRDVVGFQASADARPVFATDFEPRLAWAGPLR